MAPSAGSTDMEGEMLRIVAALSAVFATIALASIPAAAETGCADHSQITDRLATNYSESRVGIGLDENGRVIEVFASEQGSWTILVTFPDGRTCLMAAGEAWEPAMLAVTGPTA